MSTATVTALAFDVFGTVVDWRQSIIDEGRRLGRARGIEADWAAFADAWRRAYQPSMDRVRRGELPWTKLDALHRMALDELIREFRIAGLSETDRAELNRAWHRLRPWPDAVDGLERLRRRFIVATLSNGNVSLLVEMAKRAALPWDCILSAEIFRAYKPDPRVYRGAVELLADTPDQVMLVAAHPEDLRAAQREGLRTALVPRPLEWGAATPLSEPDPSFDLVASDFLDLARQLGS